MSSRLIAIGFCMLDATTTLLAVVQGSTTMLIIILSLIISTVLAFTSYLIRSVFWPSHFWDVSPESFLWGKTTYNSSHDSLSATRERIPSQDVDSGPLQDDRQDICAG
jgi:hypothetical protein